MWLKQNKTPYVLPESIALVVIGGLDLLYTVYLIATRQAHEANPLFQWILSAYGETGFVTFKALMLAVPLTIAEMASKRNPQFVRKALRLCILLYLAVYLVNILRQS